MHKQNIRMTQISYWGSISKIDLQRVGGLGPCPPRARSRAKLEIFRKGRLGFRKSRLTSANVNLTSFESEEICSVPMCRIRNSFFSNKPVNRVLFEIKSEIKILENFRLARMKKKKYFGAETWYTRVKYSKSSAWETCSPNPEHRILI